MRIEKTVSFTFVTEMPQVDGRDIHEASLTSNGRSNVIVLRSYDDMSTPVMLTHTIDDDLPQEVKAVYDFILSKIKLDTFGLFV